MLLFNDLQKRLNRKNITKKLLEDVPVGFRAYDILELNSKDIREKSLFVEFTYGKEITSQSVIQSQANDLEIDVCEETVFVALKNGHHTSEGYLVASDPNILSKFRDTDHVSSIFQLIANNFNIELS